MSLKKLMSILCMLTISLLVFTACETDPDPEDPPIGPTITVAPVGTIFAGQTGANVITIQWNASPSQDSSWFEGYEVTVSGQETPVTIKNNWYEFAGLNASTTYTFTIRALGKNADTIVKSTAKTIDWALASHFEKNDVGAAIKVYVKESSNYGSGLNLFDAEEAPSNWKVTSGGKWNLAVGSKNELIFGTASSVVAKMGYTLSGNPKDPVDAEISDPIDFDTDNLANLLLDQDISKIGYSKKYIDLNASANNREKGLVLFAKVNNHYAKIIVLKKNGKYLQDESTSDPFVQFLVSYQKRSGVPYAKPTTN